MKVSTFCCIKKLLLFSCQPPPHIMKAFAALSNAGVWRSPNNWELEQYYCIKCRERYIRHIVCTRFPLNISYMKSLQNISFFWAFVERHNNSLEKRSAQKSLVSNKLVSVFCRFGSNGLVRRFKGLYELSLLLLGWLAARKLALTTSPKFCLMRSLRAPN